MAENNAGGTAESNNSGSVTFTSTIAPYSDLTVTNVSIDPSTLTSSGTFVVNWNDSNIGSKATGVAWVDLVVIKNLTTGETLATVSVPYDPAAAGNGAIAGGASRAPPIRPKRPALRVP